MNHDLINDEDWQKLSIAAWKCREAACISGTTKVGAALLTPDKSIFSGCNIQHYYCNHDIHAEVNAISTMVASGYRLLYGILIVAEREQFTPCGSCMDWIFQFGGASCCVGVQANKNGRIKIFQSAELMPYYPK